jgi:hypothetical protein
MVYRCCSQIDSVLIREMKCSTEEQPLEVPEDYWVPPPVSQSFVSCKWVSHSLRPDASSFPYCQVKWLRLWPNKASECSIFCHARMQLMQPLKVPGVSRCLITCLLCNLYTIIQITFYSCLYKLQISIYRQIANGCFWQWSSASNTPNGCQSMCDLQRLSRTAFLHLSVPLSSERQLNCWAT